VDSFQSRRIASRINALHGRSAGIGSKVSGTLAWVQAEPFPALCYQRLASVLRYRRKVQIAKVMLREELRMRLLADRGIFAREACDRCGQVLGAVRFAGADGPGSTALTLRDRKRTGADSYVLRNPLAALRKQRTCRLKFSLSRTTPLPSHFEASLPAGLPALSLPGSRGRMVSLPAGTEP